MSSAISTSAVRQSSPLTERKLLNQSMQSGGPELNPNDVEVPDSMAIEVIVLWGHDVLHVSHVVPPNGFVVGESRDNEPSCDFCMPEEILGAPRLRLVIWDGRNSSIVIPPQATGYFENPNEPGTALQSAKPTMPWSEIPGAYLQTLSANGKASLQLGDFTFHFAAVAAGRPCEKGLAACRDARMFGFFGLSLAAVAGIVTAMAYLVPSQNSMEDESFDADQVYVIRQYLRASAERESEVQPEQVKNVDPTNQEGSSGARTKGEEGKMGTPASQAKSARYAIQGPRDNPDSHLSREQLLREATTGAMIGLLNAVAASNPNAPTAPWGRNEALGTDEFSARGNLWGDEIGQAYGANGLGLSGIGQGGGGLGEGIGLGSIGTIGHGGGTGTGQGFGVGHGSHKVRTPRSCDDYCRTMVSGRLPPEVIQRIVRQNYGRFRSCYEQGLSRNPNLEGRVQVRFVISRDGSVANAQRGDSDLPDSGVVGCVVNAYYGLSFPQPEGGIVTVVYPIMFQPS